MLFRFVSGKKTLIKNVEKFLPGHSGFYKNGILKVKSYYKFEDRILKMNNLKSLEDYIDEIDDGLTNAVKAHMISDAPVGLSLSGGLDSSLLTAIIQKKFNTGNIKTFSIKFNEHKINNRLIDESYFSNKIAKIFNTDHKQINLNESNFANLLTKSIWHHDEPLNFPNSVGLFLLNSIASQKVKVLIGGEGADEIFGGYDEYTDPKFDLYNRAYADISKVKELFKNKKLDLNFKIQLLKTKFSNTINKNINYNIYTQLQTIQSRLDKMSMAFGIESRVPFLDQKLVEKSLNLPSSLKVNNSIGKFILKKVAERYLPSSFIYRKKIGFSVPINKWITKSKYMKKHLDLLREERTLSRKIYNFPAINNLLKNKFKDKQFVNSDSGFIWNLLNLEIWIRMFIEDKKSL